VGGGGNPQPLPRVVSCCFAVAVDAFCDALPRQEGQKSKKSCKALQRAFLSRLVGCVDMAMIAERVAKASGSCGCKRCLAAA